MAFVSSVSVPTVKRLALEAPSAANEYVIGCINSNGTHYIPDLLIDRISSNHFATGYGYRSKSTGFFAIVNDGWGRTGIEIHSNYNITIIW